MPGGIFDGGVDPSWRCYIGTFICDNPEAHEVIICHNIWVVDALTSWQFDQQSQQRVHAGGLGHLPHIMFSHLDFLLISVFVESWKPDMSTSHLLFEEMAIMLYDVWWIIRVFVEGSTVSGAFPYSYFYVRLEELLQCTREELFQQNAPIWKNTSVGIQEIFDRCKLPCQPADVKIHAFFLITLGCSLFLDKSGTWVLPRKLLSWRP